MTMRHNPYRLLATARPWAATAYLASYLAVGTAFFVISLLAVVLGGALGMLTIAVPLLIGSAGILRGCAEFERLRARFVGVVIGSKYRKVTEPGVVGQVRTRWTDPATYRDCAYLIVFFLPLIILDFLALVVWITLLALVTVPVWFWALPDGLFGTGLLGLDYSAGLWVGDLPSALIASVCALVVAPLPAYFVVTAARWHAAIARRLLSPHVDPLAPAKEMLAQPGPLTA